MPETAVHKNGEPCFSKEEIRFAENLLMPPPASDAMETEQFHQGQLGVPVALAPDAGHDSGPLGFGKNIRHRLIFVRPKMQ